MESMSLDTVYHLFACILRNVYSETDIFKLTNFIKCVPVVQNFALKHKKSFIKHLQEAREIVFCN